MKLLMFLFLLLPLKSITQEKPTEAIKDSKFSKGIFIGYLNSRFSIAEKN
jgi:hypothetical protein